MKRLWGLMSFFMIAKTAMASGIPARPFDEAQCGLNYPKLPEDRTVAPIGPFKRHNFNDEYWPLVCKSVGRHDVPGAKVEHKIDWSLRGTINMQVTYTFKKALVAAGKLGENLKMGECAFADRPLNNDEPNKITTFVMDDPINLKFEKTVVANRGVTKSEIDIETDYDRIMEDGFIFFIYVKNAPILKAFDSIPLCDRRPLGIRPVFYIMKR